MDYKELLKKYMSLVGDTEGSDFLNRRGPVKSAETSYGEITKNEMIELLKLSLEL